GSWRVQQLGNQFPHSQRLNRDLSFVAPLSIAGAQPLTLYVRVHTPSSLVHARVISETDASELDGRTYGVIGVYAGIGLTVMMLSLVGWFSTRQPLWLYSSLFDAGTLLLVAVQLGFVAKYLLPDAANRVNHLLVVVNCAHLALVCLFFWRLFRLFEAKWWCSLPYRVSLCLFPLQLLLIIAGRPGLALTLNNLLILLLAVWALVVVWFVRPQDRILRWLWRVLYLALGLYILYWVSPMVLRLSPPTALSLYPALPSNLLTMLMTVSIIARFT
ncbi:7TMR-DISMED2 domain-containing protein, partial [Roseateles sp. GG27B]